MAKPLKFKDFIATDTSQSDDDQIAFNSKKRKEEVETEALNMQQRLAKSRQMKKLKSKIAIGRKRAMRKTANMDTLKKRAQKAARNFFLKKISKDIPKGDLSMSRRQEIEKRLDKMKPRIDKMAKKLLPKVRKKELDRKRGGSSSDN